MSTLGEARIPTVVACLLWAGSALLVITYTAKAYAETASGEPDVLDNAPPGIAPPGAISKTKSAVTTAGDAVTAATTRPRSGTGGKFPSSPAASGTSRTHWGL